jgi:hypothetical protein
VPLPPGPTIAQPQYADVKYPPGATTPVTFGQPSGPYAAAVATQNEAVAEAHLASTATSAGVSSDGQTRALRVALAAWRNRWLSAEGMQRYPMPRAATAAAPADGVAGDTANSHAVFDPKSGVLTLVCEAHANRASFGGGLVQIRGVHTKLTLTNDGSTTKDAIVIEVSSALVAGVPVVIDQNGVTVANTAVPGVMGGLQAANAALNQALAAAGVKVFTISPAITKGPNQETVDATGVHVQFVQPAVAVVPQLGGLPQQNLDHIIGEAFGSSLAVPGQPTSTAGSIGGDLGGTASGGATTGSAGTAGSAGTFIPGSPGSAGTPGTPALSLPGAASGPRTATLTPLRRISHTKPTYLLLLYFLWQTTVLGAVASLWLWRMKGSSA